MRSRRLAATLTLAAVGSLPVLMAAPASASTPLPKVPASVVEAYCAAQKALGYVNVADCRLPIGI